MQIEVQHIYIYIWGARDKYLLMIVETYGGWRAYTCIYRNDRVRGKGCCTEFLASLHGISGMWGVSTVANSSMRGGWRTHVTRKCEDFMSLALSSLCLGSVSVFVKTYSMHIFKRERDTQSDWGGPGGSSRSNRGCICICISSLESALMAIHKGRYLFSVDIVRFVVLSPSIVSFCCRSSEGQFLLIFSRNVAEVPLLSDAVDR